MGFFKLDRIGSLVGIKHETDEQKIAKLESEVRNGDETRAFKSLIFYREIFAPKIYSLKYSLTKQLSNDIDGRHLQGQLSILSEIEDFIEQTVEKGRLAKPELEKLKEKLNVRE